MSDINVILCKDSISVTMEWNASWPPWPPGPVTTGTYVHNQSTPLSTWAISHNLWMYLALIVVIDSGWTNIVNFHITYVDINTLTLEFSWGTSGTAYLS